MFWDTGNTTLNPDSDDLNFSVHAFVPTAAPSAPSRTRVRIATTRRTRAVGIPEYGRFPATRLPSSPAPGQPRVPGPGGSQARDPDEGYWRCCGLWHLKTIEKSRCTSGAAEAAAFVPHRPVPVPSERARRLRRLSARARSAAGSAEGQPKLPRCRSKSPEQSAEAFPSPLSYNYPGSFWSFLRENENSKKKKKKAWM